MTSCDACPPLPSHVARRNVVQTSRGPADTYSMGTRLLWNRHWATLAVVVAAGTGTLPVAAASTLTAAVQPASVSKVVAQVDTLLEGDALGASALRPLLERARAQAANVSHTRQGKFLAGSTQSASPRSLVSLLQGVVVAHDDAAGTVNAALALLQSGRSLATDADAEGVVYALSSQLLKLQGEVDVVRSDCELEKRYIQERSDEYKSEASRATQSVASLEKQIARNAGELAPTSNSIGELRDEQHMHHKNCKARRAELFAQWRKAKVQLRKTRRLKRSTLKTCSSGSLLLICTKNRRGRGSTLVVANARLRGEASRLAGRDARLGFSQTPGRSAVTSVLLQTHHFEKSIAGRRNEPVVKGWVREPKPLPPSASKPDPAPHDPNRAAVCSPKASPTCVELKDSMDDMEDTVVQQILDAVSKLRTHDDECREKAETLNAQLHEKVWHLSKAQSLLSLAESSKSGFQISMAERDREMQTLANRLLKKKKGVQRRLCTP